MRLFDQSIPAFTPKQKDADELAGLDRLRRNALGQIGRTTTGGSEWTMIGFATFSLFGTILLAYYCLSGLEQTALAGGDESAPVYDAHSNSGEPAADSKYSAGRLRIPAPHTGVPPHSRRHHDDSPGDSSRNVTPDSSAEHPPAHAYALPPRDTAGFAPSSPLA